MAHASFEAKTFEKDLKALILYTWGKQEVTTFGVADPDTEVHGLHRSSFSV